MLLSFAHSFRTCTSVVRGWRWGLITCGIALEDVTRAENPTGDADVVDDAKFGADNAEADAVTLD